MKGYCIWLTGLPCSGKTTLAKSLSNLFEKENINHDVLDGDELRTHFSKGLGFSKEDRIENARRIGFLASKIVKHGGIAIVSIVSPYQVMRDLARDLVEKEGGKFFEIFVDTPLSVCKNRDVKGLYAKALNNEIKNFTGISDPYEVPKKPDLIVHTNDSFDNLVLFLTVEGILKFNNKPRALFIGRWQPFHNGHDYIIRQKLAEGVPVLIAVRDTIIDEGNPFTVQDRLDMIREAYIGDDVQVISIPDIESVNIGRNVGYAVNEYKVPENIAGISATQVRKAMKEKDWEKIRSTVPDGTYKFLKRKENLE